MQQVEEGLRKLPVSQIVAGDNDRTVFDEKDLNELAESIGKDGLNQPPTVRPIMVCPKGHRSEPYVTACSTCGLPVERRYEIVAGERRFRAVSTILQWTEMDAIVRHLNQEQADSIMLSENVHRKDLNAIDEARAYDKRIKRYGWSNAEAAKNAGVGDRRVTARLKLLNLMPEVQDMIAKNQLGVAFGEAMSVLDVNRQRIALGHLQSKDKVSQKEFNAICNKLAEEQAQESMFDLNALVAQAVEEFKDERGNITRRRFPVAEWLPEMKRRGNIAKTFEHYLVELMSSPDPRVRDAAEVVGRVYSGMIAGGMAYPPAVGSPLDEYHQKLVTTVT